MERIKEALERARRERVERTDAPPAPEPVRAASSAGAGAPELQPAARAVELDAAVLARHRVLTGRPEHEFAADAYRLLRTRVVQVMRANGWRSLGITSPSVGEGVSVTAINLAISLAREVEQNVILVDLDLRRPRLHELLGIDVAFGLGDYLDSEEPLTKALVRPSIDRLLLLPGRTGQPCASELISAPRMRQLVDEIIKRYPDRFVLFDMPPVCMSDDVLAFSPLIDALLLVVRDNYTDQTSLRRAVELLRDVNLVGTVLTMSDDPTTVAY